MGARKSTIIGAAGAVAAATAVGVAVARRMGREPEVWHVRPSQEGWAVSRDGAEAPSSVHGTKKEAVSEGRRIARENAPGTLVLHYADGSVQRELAYERED